MAKTFFLGLALFHFAIAFSQNGYIVLKKRHKSTQHFWKDSHFTFQTKDGQWITGIITQITRDSFYLTQEIIRYHIMGADTMHISGFRFSLNDVNALPGKSEEIAYDNDQVRIIPGNEKFVWVRNGFIFQLGSAAYMSLNIINDLAQKEPPFAKNNLTRLGTGAAVFLIGTLLHWRFDPYIHPGKKYHLELVSISRANK